MKNEDYVLVIRHQGNCLTKQFGDERSVYHAEDQHIRQDRFFNRIFIPVGAKRDYIEKAIEQRHILNTEAYGAGCEDELLAGKEVPTFLLDVVGGRVLMTWLNRKNMLHIESPEHAVATYIANCNWWYCKALEEDIKYDSLLYLEKCISTSKVDQGVEYKLGAFECPKDLTKMATDIRSVLSMYDRYLDMRKIEHIPFVKH